MRPHYLLLSVVLLTSSHPPDDRAGLIRAHLARAIPQHATESMLPVTVTVDSSLRCFGRVCPPVPLPAEVRIYLTDTAKVQIGALASVRVCRDTVPLTCKQSPSRTVLQVYLPAIGDDSARIGHSWYDSGGSADSWTHGEEDVYARTPEGWRFVRVNSVWQN